MSRTIISNSPEQTRAIAGRLLNELHPGSVLSLHGELGSGKTCFVQGLAESLGVKQAVTSPTYTLINEYSGRLPLYHIDLYRLRSAEDALALGMDEYLESDGITAIEWGERAEELLPDSVIHVRFELLGRPDARVITIGS